MFFQAQKCSPFVCSHEGKFWPATAEKAAYLDRGHLGYTQQFLKMQRLTRTFPGMLRKADCSGHQDHGALVTSNFNGVLAFGLSPPLSIGTDPGPHTR